MAHVSYFKNSSAYPTPRVPKLLGRVGMKLHFFQTYLAKTKVNFVKKKIIIKKTLPRNKKRKITQMFRNRHAPKHAFYLNPAVRSWHIPVTHTNSALLLSL